MQSRSVFVRLLDAPYVADCRYSYLVPQDLSDKVKLGSFVTVPFGGGNRRRAAVVVGESEDTSYTAADGRTIKFKPVLSVTQERFALSEEQLGLCSFICSSTLCTFGDAVHAILPSAAFSSLVETWKIGEKELETTQGVEYLIYSFIKRNGETAVSKILKEFGQDAAQTLDRMRTAGVVVRDFSVNESKNDKYTSYFRLVLDEEEARALVSGRRKGLRTQKQKDVLSHLIEFGRCERAVLEAQLSVTYAQLKNLCEKEYITEEKEENYRNPYLERSNSPREERVLSEEQKAAYSQLDSLYSSGEPKAALLYGVTGSGKTSVIKAMVDRVLSDGRQVIILVPEISLTPQTVDIFCGYYGTTVAVIHSSLSAGERYDAYKRISAGEADVVIGTRSAVFAPLSRLGMIVIDEEQEHTYKSDTSPKYHARDIARYRVAKSNALLLLASATPSLESYYKAKTGKYSLITLKNRYGKATLPQVEVVDMRRESRAGNLSPISASLLRSIAQTKDNDKQSILFLNRRGYNHFALCRMCGEVVECPHCSVSMTYHTSGKGKVGEDALSRAKNGYLVCHYCGYRSEVPLLCPSCGSEHMAFIGYGTQKIEGELCENFPSVAVLRMDNDTTQTKFAYENLLGSFRRREADILLGTQMVTKGHDFPDVTLVGVLDADSALHLDDYRAGERTFSLITQVIGRAGRADSPGKAVIQTHVPDDETIVLACKQDYDAFYEKEIVLRKNYMFPPFCDIVLISATCEDEVEINNAMLKLSDFIARLSENEFKDTPIVAFGPFEAPIYKLDGRYRMRMVFKCKLNSKTRELFARVMRESGQSVSKRVSLSIDLNPSNV